MLHRRAQSAQTLVLFALFLLVLLGVAALGIDYANWLLTDRQLQNVADHAALAGAAEFSSDFSASSCGGGSGTIQCRNALQQAWVSLNQDLNLGLDDGTVACLAGAGNTAAAGWKNAGDAGCTPHSFGGQTLWVSTPPPYLSGHKEYTGVGGRYGGSFGVVFARVDRPTRAFLSGVFGLAVRDRIGWATAGILPTDFALEVFCRDQIAPEHGVCANSSSLSIDGGGGISLVRGDVGSSNSLKVTQQTGPGVVVKAGNVFLVEGSCGPSTWNCPPATVGGISDGAGTAKNAFYIPPIPVPNYALPTGIDNTDCTTGPCVPGASGAPSTPQIWTCPGGICGTPLVTTVNGKSVVQCSGSAGSATQHLAPAVDDTKSNVKGTQAGATSNNLFRNIMEPYPTIDPSGTSLPAPPTSQQFPQSPTPTDFVYSTDGNPASYRVIVGSPNGTVQTPGWIYGRFVVFNTSNGVYDTLPNDGYQPTVTVQLQEKRAAGWVSIGAPTPPIAVNQYPTAYQIPQVDATMLTNPNNPTLGMLFTITSPGKTSGGDRNPRGVGISWAEIYLDQLPVPPPPPMIPPGLYRSITIGDNGCAILDPTGRYNSPGGLQQNQMPGIYNFTNGSGSAKPAISLGSSSYLIGDAVTLVFDSSWPDPTGGQGITLGANSALVLNAGLSSNQDCTAWHATNQSFPLCPLSSDALAAAWMIDPADTLTGVSPWGGACPDPYPCTVQRWPVSGTDYNPTSDYRGITFYFRPQTNGSTNPADYTVRGRFKMSGTSGSEPGIAFRGILYAPYDDVVITGGNGFNTIGMVLAWTAKFAGQATIDLDYPYSRLIAAPYLLEPGVGQ